jgi:hypothetical protein
MLNLGVADTIFVASVLLFRLAMPPRSGGKRWFIGRFWEPYIVVFLVAAIVMSVGLVVLSMTELITPYI